MHKKFSKNQLGKLSTIISESRQHLHNQHIEWVSSHGDFGLANIKTDGSNVDIIDFENFTIAPREFDIFKLLLNLENTSYFPQKPSIYQNICQQFMHGYGKYQKSMPLYNLFFTLNKLDMIHRYYLKRKNIKWWNPERLAFYYFEWQTMYRFVNWLDEYQC